ncbi:MAG: ferredoxin [Patescibacteria group bacterium]
MAEEKAKKNEEPKIVVDDDTCIGCGTCISLAPECFELNEQGKSVPKKGCSDFEKAKEAADHCPVDAIEIE